jgi:acetyl-CoA C-acetyltransferase
MSREIVIAGAVRTPIGKFGGGFAGVPAVDLGVAAAKAAIERSGIAAERIGQAFVGHARQAGCGPNPGRQVALRAGLPAESPALTINQACLSGMQALLAGARAVRLGETDVALAAGMESMSRVPYLLDGRWGLRMGHRDVVDLMYRDGFLDPLCGKLMGETAETLAERYGITRSEQDAYAARTQERCEAARAAGRFRDEITPLDVGEGRKAARIEADEHPRAGVTAEALAKLPPVFSKSGTVTAGNSSGITDGAAAALVLGADAAQRWNVEPLARIVAWHVAGVDPGIMGIGPVPAVRGLVERTGVALESVDLVELNEAFAAQVIAVDRELRLDPEKLNVNGGAIALGHPIGCSGLRIVVTLVHEMARRGVRYGLATLCVSGGMGGALLLERV